MTEQVKYPLNPADEHPPSRPGIKTTIGGVILVGLLLLYFNWASVKGLLGAE